MVGNVERVLVTGEAKRQETLDGSSRASSQLFLSGRCENNRVVNFLGEPSLIGDFTHVRITEALPNSLRGEQVAD